MTIHATLTGPVADDLAKCGLTLVLTEGSQTRGDAWCDATRQHGKRIAHIHLEDGHWATMQHKPWHDWVPVTTLYVSYPLNDGEAGANVYDMLRLHGLDAGWDYDPTQAIRVNLEG
jgi:hypothetical protein